MGSPTFLVVKQTKASGIVDNNFPECERRSVTLSDDVVTSFLILNRVYAIIVFKIDSEKVLVGCPYVSGYELFLWSLTKWLKRIDAPVRPIKWNDVTTIAVSGH